MLIHAKLLSFFHFATIPFYLNERVIIPYKIARRNVNGTCFSGQENEVRSTNDSFDRREQRMKKEMKQNEM